MVAPKERIAYKTLAYRRIALDGMRLYGPGVVLGITSVALILGSHGIQGRRIGTLAGALGIVQSSFLEYRRRIVTEHGQAADERAYLGAEERTVVILEEGEEGKTRKRKIKQNRNSEDLTPLMYARTFDYTNKNWFDERRMNKFWLEMTQNMMNDRLHINGYVFLNEAYEALGMHRSALGQLAGWAKKDTGDRFIDFGLENPINHRADEENVPWTLDFNVSGEILNYVDA